MSERDSERSALAELDGSAASDANADTGFQSSLDRCSLFGRDTKRLFCSSIHESFSFNWCSISLNEDWEHMPCNYKDHTGKDFWKEASTILNALEPAFKADYHHHYDTGEYIQVNTPKKSHVKRLKQHLTDLEPRYKGYSVPKLKRLVKVKLREARYSMRAVIEFQDKFGKDAALHMLENNADIMFTRNYRGCTWGSETVNYE
ncbi:hypothetical protein COCOBI_04-0500 [Coccomyxa sp. Obi]|nr:hypothetical protein COCOBI_04-0500 [Coccomyxa sp. Obi]